MTNEFNPDWICVCGDLTTLGIVHRKDGPCYIPDKREWVGLTDEEKRQIFEREDYQGWLDYINAIEAKLKEKNT
jgi:hypothetical protein